MANTTKSNVHILLPGPPPVGEAAARRDWVESAIQAAVQNAGAGSVTSVGLSLPTIFNVTNSPVTGAGTLTATLTSQAGSTFLSAPAGVAGVPTFRAITPGDIPTLNQNTTGSAATLTTARTINGTSFNGSGNITTANWGTARTVTIGSTGKSVNGSANVTWTLAEIGAQAALGYTAENTANKGAANGYASLGADGKVPSNQLPSYVDDVLEATNYAALPATGETGKIYITIDDGKIFRWSGSAYINISSSVSVADTAMKLNTARTIALSGAVTGTATAFDGSANISIPVTAVAASSLTGTIDVARSWALTGDVTSPAGSSATTIVNGAVSLSKMASLPANTIIGNNTGSAATPLALSVAQVKTLLSITKADIGLGNVDNTSDLNKPISTAMQTALDGKLSTTGTAAAATKLATARTLTIGATGKTFDGTGNVAWTLTEIGAPSTSGTGASGTWGISITGNAATASRVSFADTRAVNDQPSAIPNQSVSYAFKSVGSVDNPPVAAGSGYAHIGNYAGWNSGGVGGGGFNTQVSYGDGLAVRQATSTTAWGPWRKVWHDGNFTPTLSGLTNVTLTAPSDGQVLSYDSATSKWVNRAAAGSSGGLTWTTVVNSDVTAVTNNGYLMDTGATLRTITLPLNVPAGFYIAIKVVGSGGVRVVANGNVIVELGAGNNLLLEDGNAVTLLGKAASEVVILYGVGGAPAAEAASNLKWTVINDARTLTPNQKYLVDATAGALSETLPSPLTPGDSFIVHAVGNLVTLLTNGNTVSGVPVGDDLGIADGETVHLVARTTTALNIV